MHNKTVFFSRINICCFSIVQIFLCQPWVSSCPVLLYMMQWDNSLTVYSHTLFLFNIFTMKELSIWIWALINIVIIVIVKQKILQFLIVRSGWKRLTGSPTNDKKEGIKKIQRTTSKYQKALLYLIFEFGSYNIH